MTKDELIKFRNDLIEKKENNYILISKLNDIMQQSLNSFEPETSLEFIDIDTIKKQIKTSEAVTYFEEICEKMTELYIEKSIEFDEIKINISIDFYVNEICAKKIRNNKTSLIKFKDILINTITLYYSITPYFNHEKVQTPITINSLYKSYKEITEKTTPKIIEYNQFITEIKKIGYNIIPEIDSFEKLMNYIQDNSLNDITLTKIKFEPKKQKTFLLTPDQTIYRFTNQKK